MSRVNFSKDFMHRLVLKPSTAATSLNSTSAVIDRAGFDSMYIFTAVGQTATDGVVSLTALGSTASGGTYQQFSSATVVTTTAQMDGLLALDLDKANPDLRYATVRCHRNGGNCDHGGIHVILYNSNELPITEDSTSFLQATVRTVGST